MQRLLIQNGTVITLGERCRVLHHHDVLIEAGVIRRMAKTGEIAVLPEDKVFNAKGQVIMPGLINAHMHFYSTLVRGLTKAKPSVSFREMLDHLWWRLDRQLTLDDTYVSTLVILLNAIRHGTTTFIDHHASPFAARGSLQAIATAVQEVGLRACLCYEVSDRDGEAIRDQGIAENIEFIEDCQNHPNDQVKALFGLHASFTVSDETLKKAVGAAKKLQVGFHVHTAEADSDQQETIKTYHQRVVERFYDRGVLGSQTILAHGVHLNEAEIDLIAKTDAMVVHNPQSNMNNGVGIADIVTMAKKGILVGLGTDAMTVNMFEENRVALWAQHLRANPSVGFMEAASTLFVNNSKIASRIWKGLKIGVLEEGAVADVILIDYIPPTPLTDETVLGHLIFGLSQGVVDTTIARGRVLMQNKQLQLGIDEAVISKKSRELTERLWARF